MCLTACPSLFSLVVLPVVGQYLRAPQCPLLKDSYSEVPKETLFSHVCHIEMRSKATCKFGGSEEQLWGVHHTLPPALLV